MDTSAQNLPSRRDLLSGLAALGASALLPAQTPASNARAMDRDGVAASMLSCTTPGVWFGDPEETRGLARELNDFGAKIVSDHKGRFGLFAVRLFPKFKT